MLTLLSTTLSFLMGGLPKVLDFFKDKSDKRHELEILHLQTQRELELKNLGLESQERIEHINTEQLQISTAAQERSALYAHDIAIGAGASQWVINLRASVRPAITYGLFLLFAFVEVAGFFYAWRHGVSFDVLLTLLWDKDTQIIWASVIAFWFGTQAFSKT